MTREEAITILKDISWQMGSVKRWENIEALDMAIEALQAMDKAIEVEFHSGEYDLESGIVTYYCVPKAEPTHGRLIDADALKETMKIAVVKHICTNTLYNTIMAVIDGAPTVQADRPHREWILECDSEGEGDNLYRCSECGCEYGCQEYDKPNFCPNCGTRMYKGGDDK